MFVENYNLNSPLITTPYLDASTIDTPYIDGLNADTPPFYDQITDFSTYIMYPNIQTTENLTNDVCVAGYLDQHMTNKLITHDEPVAKFNGDPNLLLIDKSKAEIATVKNLSPIIKLETVNEEKENQDRLFPPLSQEHNIDLKFIKDNDQSLDELIGFNISSPLSELEDEDINLEESKKQENKLIKRGRKRKNHNQENSRKSAKTTENKKQEFYQCPKCQHKSKRRYNLSTHMKTHDKNRIKEFGCTICPKRFDRRHDRDRHLTSVHSKERTHGCPLCINQFSRKDALNRHLIQKHGYDESELTD